MSGSPRTAPSRLARASYRDISLYAPERAPCRIDLSDNTNRWGMPPAAERVVRSFAVESVTRYPGLYASRLKEALSGYTGISPDMLVTGCGSDDVLDSAFRAFGEPGERVAYCTPTFPMIPLFAHMNGLVPIEIPFRAAYDMDVDAVLSSGARIIYLCSPNNPTGTLVSRTTIKEIIDRAPPDTVVILDEAYSEFAGASAVDLVASSDRFLVTRTLSKAFGLAGLRVGYAAGAPSLVAEVEKSRGPYKVSALAELAATAALEEDLDWVNYRVAEARANRHWLELALKGAGLSPIPSAANFVLVPVARAVDVAREMRARGVAVRAFDGLPAITPALEATAGAALRISVGPSDEIAAALAALDEARRACE